MEPILSILIPTWNRADFTLRAVESVEIFSPEVEIIVIDNASTPELFAKLEEGLKKFPNVRLFRNEQNLGMVRNWNACLVKAKGQWLSLLCSDDSYQVGAVARALALLPKTQASFVVQDPSLKEDILCQPGSETVKNIKTPFASGNFWRKEVVEKLGAFDERFEYSADAEYWYRIAKVFPTLKVKDLFARYEQHKENYAWSTWRKPDFLEQSELLARTVLSYIYENQADIDAEANLAMFHTCVTVVQNALLDGYSDLFHRYFALAWEKAHDWRRKKFLLTAILQILFTKYVRRSKIYQAMRKLYYHMRRGMG